MRGFLGGVSVGALLAAGGLAMLSLSVPLPEPVSETSEQPPEDTAQTKPQPVEHDPGEAPELQNGSTVAAEAPDSSQPKDADLVEAQPSAPATATSSTDNLSALTGADTAPAGKPSVETATGKTAQESPGASDAPGIPQEEVSALPQASAPSALEAPGSETAVDASTEPAAEPEEPVQTAEADPAVENPDATQSVTEPEVPAAPKTSAVLVPDIGSAPQATTLPVIGAAPVPPAETAGEEESEDAPDSSIEISEDPTSSGDVGQEDAQATLSPSIGTPVVPLTERDKPESDQIDAGDTAGQKPFAAFAEPFENPEERPLMSIVLIDDAGAVGAEALAEFPYPLSFAISPEDPDAAEKMAARRAAGFEVLLMADLPRQATPQDAETALEVWRGNLPEAVAILEGVETGVQGNRPLADQVAAVAASAGYGLVTQNSGLNTVQKLALRDGVPAGVVFRDFDGAGQNPRAIRRFLDQAAFRAGQEGAVIMLGRLRPDTISALLIWGLQDRASRVALAPVSASLEAQLPK